MSNLGTLFYFRMGQSVWSTASFMLVTDIQLEANQLLVLGEELDWDSGQFLRKLTFSMPLYGLSNSKGYSKRQPFGVLLTAYGNRNSECVGRNSRSNRHPVLGFVHRKRTAHRQYIETLNGLLSIEALSFPWYSNN